MTNKHRTPARYLLSALATVLLLTATSCELFLSDTGGGGGGDGDEIIINSPYKIDFGASSTKTVSLTGLSGDSVYLVKSNVSSSIASGANTGYAASSSASNRSITDTPMIRNDNLSELVSGNFDGVIRYDYQPARDFNANPPAIERNNSRSLVPIANSSLVEYTQVNVDTRSFNVQKKDGTWISISTTLRAIGEHCYIWVPADNYGISTLNNDNIITEAQVDTLQEKFDAIYPLETNVFGYEYGGNSDGGVDHDLHISILVYDIGYDYKSTQTGGTLGYFWSKDFFTQTELDNNDYTSKTNLTEMFYIDSHFTDFASDTMYSTLVHEFQHMINFNRKYVEKGLVSENWYNEMLSQVAEDMLNSHISNDTTGSPSSQRISYLNAYYDQVGVNEFFNVDAAQSTESMWKNLVSYSTSYAFGAYLVRNYGGANLLKALEENSAIGQDSISLALHTVDPFTFTDTISGFKNAYRRYGEAFIYSGDFIPSGVKTFDKDVFSTINGTVYTFPAIDIWTIVNPRYDPADEFMLSGAQGPIVWDAASYVDMPPYSISLLSSKDWLNQSEDLSIILHKPTDPDVELYLMIR